mgnify:FL=1
MPKAMIFDIQRNSFVDGPGIRTTVFFKGCNLRCKWCHNPESQSFEKQMLFYKDKCTGCGKCREVCPNHLQSCDFCGKCELYCPAEARKICGREYTSDEVLAEVIKDKAFYDNSGGGVTFSGGECMLQLDFLREILDKCKSAGIHTAVDTAGNVPWESFEKILPFTDLFLYDIKAFGAELHRKGTGVSNELILENLKNLSGRADIIVRIPVIGGYNDNDEEIRQIADFLKQIKIIKAELLPYHAMGEHKYTALGRNTESFNVPNKNFMNRSQQLFLS